MATDNGWKSLDAALKRLIAHTTAEAMNELEAGAHRMASVMKAAAPELSGDLADSIHVTGPGQSVPAGAKPYGPQVAADNQVIITAGNEEVRYPHLVEFGTATQEAQPYFWPAYRLLEKDVRAKARRKGMAAAKKAWNQ